MQMAKCIDVGQRQTVKERQTETERQTYDKQKAQTQGRARQVVSEKKSKLGRKSRRTKAGVAAKKAPGITVTAIVGGKIASWKARKHNQRANCTTPNYSMILHLRASDSWLALT